MPHRFFSHGLTPFERAPYRPVAYLFDQPDLHQPLGRELRRPVFAPLGRVEAGQRHQVASWRPSSLRCTMSRRAWAAPKAPPPSLPPRSACARSLYNLEPPRGGCGLYLLVGAPLVREQERVRPSEQPTSTASALANHLPQPLPLLLVEVHHVLLLPLRGRSSRSFSGTVLAKGFARQNRSGHVLERARATWSFPGRVP